MINPLNIRSDMTESFRREHREFCLRRSKLVLLLALTFNLIFTGTDFYFGQGHGTLFFVLRTFFSLQIIASYLFLTFFRSAALRLSSATILVLGFTIGVILSVMCFFTGGLGSLYASGFIFVVLTVQAVLPWHPAYQVALWVIHQSLYLSQLFFIDADLRASDIFSYNWMIFAVGFLSSITAYFQYRLKIELKEAQAEVTRSETLSAIGALSAGVAHNVNTYLSGADMALTLLTEGQEDPKLKSLATTAQESIRSTKGIVSLLEDFSQKNREGYRWIDLADCLDEVTRIFALSPEATRLTVHRSCEKGSRAFCDPQQIKSALFNLLRNSLQSGAKNVWLNGHGDHGEVVVSVRDDGSGIPKEVQSKIFEPFFTTKDVGEGIGLGLWMVYRTMKEHGGDVRVGGGEGKGTEFVLSLPVFNQL